MWSRRARVSGPRQPVRRRRQLVAFLERCQPGADDVRQRAARRRSRLRAPRRAAAGQQPGERADAQTIQPHSSRLQGVAPCRERVPPALPTASISPYAQAEACAAALTLRLGAHFATHPASCQSPASCRQRFLEAGRLAAFSVVVHLRLLRSGPRFTPDNTGCYRPITHRI
jgi:hypothetical protein